MYVCSGFFYNPSLRQLYIGCSSGTGAGSGGIHIWTGSTGDVLNTQIGFFAGFNSQTFDSTLIGRQAGFTGYQNGSVGIGANALFNSSGKSYVAIGRSAAQRTWTLSNQGYNIAIGDFALADSGNAEWNTAVGAATLFNNSSGFSYCVALGNQAGILTNGNRISGSIFIGCIAKGAGTLNEIVIGFNASGFGNNSITIGNVNHMSGKIYGNINFPHGISFPSGGVTSGGVFTASIGSGLIQSGAIASGQIGANHFGAGAITSGYFLRADGTGILSWGAATATLTSGQVVSGNIGNNAVNSGNIASGQIGNFHIASGAITSGDIGQFAVLNINIVSGTVANDKLINSAITIAGSSTALGGSWAAAALTTSSGLLAGTFYPSGALTIGIASGGITNQMIADGAITSGDIASGQVGANHFGAGAITSGYFLRADGTGILSWGTTSAASLTSGQVVSGLIGNNAVNSGNIASGSIGTFHLANGAVVSGDIGANIIGSPHILAGSIANASLTNSSITIAGSSTALGGSWAAQALTTASGLLAGTFYPSGALTIGIATAGVVNAMIASGAVTSGNIASGQVGNNALTSTIADKTIVGDVQAINYQSGAYTLVSGDAGKLITINSVSTANLTIPTNASVPMTIGTHIDFIQLGAGQVTISGNIGVTINYTPGNKLRTQYAGASVIKIGTDTWCLVGDISA